MEKLGFEILEEQYSREKHSSRGHDRLSRGMINEPHSGVRMARGFDEDLRLGIHMATEFADQDLPCPIWAMGTASLYCIDQANTGLLFEKHLGKPKPGDVDFGHFCPRGDVNSFIKAAVEKLEGVSVTTYPHNDAIDLECQLSGGRCKYDTIDRHQKDAFKLAEELEIDISALDNSACLCSTGACKGMPVGNLDVIYAIYSTKEARNHKVDEWAKKIALIEALQAEFSDTKCGACGDAYGGEVPRAEHAVVTRS